MSTSRTRLIIGGALILFGLLALLGTAFTINLSGLIWALLFATGGVVFIAMLVGNRSNWWAIIPGFALLSIGTIIGLDVVAPRLNDLYGGAIFLGGIGASFLIIYFLQPGFWWALIPAGALLSLAALIILEPFLSEPGWVFLLGLAATFGVLTQIKDEKGEKLSWAVYPAIVLLIVTFIVMVASVAWAGYIWPVALILGGLVLIIRAVRRS